MGRMDHDLTPVERRIVVSSNQKFKNFGAIFGFDISLDRKRSSKCR
jgi:hypothetical protein